MQSLAKHLNPLIALFLVLLSCNAWANDTAHTQNTSLNAKFIEGGKHAGNNFFKYSVSLQYDLKRYVRAEEDYVEIGKFSNSGYGNNIRKNHYCSGTVIHSRWIMTAAHCVISVQAIDNSEKVKITQKLPKVLSAYSLSSPAGAFKSQKVQKINALQVIVHPKYIENIIADIAKNGLDYTQLHSKYDIAFIKLSSHLIDVQTVALAYNPKLTAQENTIYSIGWGSSSTYNPLNSIQNQLQSIVFSVANNDFLANSAEKEGIIKIRHTKGGPEAGDSGSPLIQRLAPQFSKFRSEVAMGPLSGGDSNHVIKDATAKNRYTAAYKHAHFIKCELNIDALFINQFGKKVAIPCVTNKKTINEVSDCSPVKHMKKLSRWSVNEKIVYNDTQETQLDTESSETMNDDSNDVLSKTWDIPFSC